MIPTDLASRLRVLLDLTVQPTNPVRGIPSDLLDFETGQHFTAQVQNPLPDGSFRAIVEGKTITLALPEAAKSGDVLELIVTGKNGATVQARQIASAASPGPGTNDLPKPVLSQTGQLISQLLTGRFGEPEPVPLAKGASLLPAAPQSAADLVPALKQAITSSGLFYESHLREWAAGKLPLASLLQEPQAQQVPLPSPGTPLPEKPAQLTSTTTTPEEQSGKPLSTQQTENSRLPETIAPKGTDDATDSAKASPAQLEAFAEQAGKSSSGKSVADPLMPVVQQQLETLATHQMLWAGQAWPGMPMQWDITHPDPQNRSSGDEDTQAWRSGLRLQLPSLGDIQAQLVLTAKGLSVHIDTNSGASAQRMRAAQAQLQDSLEAAGVPVIAMQVSEHASA